MSDAGGREKRIGLLIDVLAKLHAVVELAGEPCPLCRAASAHDAECPLALAWSLLDIAHRAEVRRNVRAYALSVELAPLDAGPLVH